MQKFPTFLLQLVDTIVQKLLISILQLVKLLFNPILLIPVMIIIIVLIKKTRNIRTVHIIKSQKFLIFQ